MKGTRHIKVKLAGMSFIEFAVWGSYLISLGNFLAKVGLEKDIYWF